MPKYNLRKRSAEDEGSEEVSPTTHTAASPTKSAPAHASSSHATTSFTGENLEAVPGAPLDFVAVLKELGYKKVNDLAGVKPETVLEKVESRYKEAHPLNKKIKTSAEGHKEHVDVQADLHLGWLNYFNYLGKTAPVSRDVRLLSWNQWTSQRIKQRKDEAAFVQKNRPKNLVKPTDLVAQKQKLVKVPNKVKLSSKELEEKRAALNSTQGPRKLAAPIRPIDLSNTRKNLNTVEPVIRYSPVVSGSPIKNKSSKGNASK